MVFKPLNPKAYAHHLKFFSHKSVYKIYIYEYTQMKQRFHRTNNYYSKVTWYFLFILFF